MNTFTYFWTCDYTIYVRYLQEETDTYSHIRTSNTEDVFKKHFVLNTFIYNKKENAFNMPQLAHRTCVARVQSHLTDWKGKNMLVEKQHFLSFILYYNLLCFETASNLLWRIVYGQCWEILHCIYTSFQFYLLCVAYLAATPICLWEKKILRTICNSTLRRRNFNTLNRRAF